MMTLVERMELYCRDTDGNPMSGGEASGIDVGTLQEAIERIGYFEDLCALYGIALKKIMDEAQYEGGYAAADIARHALEGK